MSMKENLLTPVVDHEQKGQKRNAPSTPAFSATIVNEFTPSEGLTSEEAARLLAIHGRNELEEKTVSPIVVFCTLLIQPMPMMIWVAILVEAIIKNWPDFSILLGIQFMNASISFYETTKAGNAVAALKSALKPLALCKRDGKFREIDAALLVPGDLVLLGSGGSIPADCIINEQKGNGIEVDQSALTGESLPVSMHGGSRAKMGSNVVKGEVHATVHKTGSKTFFGEAATLLQQGETESSNLEKTLIRIIIVLVLLSLALCGFAFYYLYHIKGVDLTETLSFTVVLMVASIPLAVEIVCTTTLALGSRQMAKFGAIVSRLSAIEDMAGLNVLCSDKTGTLTLNKMAIQDDSPVFLQGEDQASLLRYAAMAARWLEPPRDALDTLVLNAVDMKSLEGVEQTDYMPFDPSIKRTEGTVILKNGRVMKCTKGAPNIIIGLCNDDASIKQEAERHIRDFGRRGIRSLAIAITNEDDEWTLAGLITFLDPPRPDTKETIARAAEYGVQVKMITGDHLLIAKETARVLGMGTNIQNHKQLPTLDEQGNPPKNLVEKWGKMISESDGFAQMFPSHKYVVVECLRLMGMRVGMTGDGVNDAPALKRGDVGIAVCGSTDTARAAADIILTHEGLSTIVDGIITSRRIFARMSSFLTYRIAATLQLLFFFFIAVLTLEPDKFDGQSGEDWPAFFQMPVLLLMLITLLNDGTLISIGYDNVEASQYPNKWNLPALFTVSTALGAVACGSSLVMVYACLDSWNPNSWFQYLGIGGVSYGHITAMVYLKVSVSDFLTLFSARTAGHFFWHSMPAPLLLGAGGLAIGLSTTLAVVWPDTILDGVPVTGLGHHPEQLLFLWVWGYCLVVWFIQDTLKVCTFWFLRSYNVFDINGTRGREELAKTLGGGPTSGIASTRRKGGYRSITASAEDQAKKQQRKREESPGRSRMMESPRSGPNGVNRDISTGAGQGDFSSPAWRRTPKKGVTKGQDDDMTELNL